MNHSNRRQSIACGCLLLAGIVVSSVVWDLHDRDPDLLARSRPLSGLRYMDTVIGWLSAHDMLLVGPSHQGHQAVDLDTTTGQRRHLPELSRSFRTFPNIPALSCLSPDRNMVLNSGTSAHDSFDNSYWPVSAVDLNGRKHGGWSIKPRNDYTAPIWLADSAHWLEFRLIGKQDRTVVILHTTNASDRALGQYDGYGAPIGLDRAGHLLLYNEEQAKKTVFKFDKLDINTGLSVGQSLLPLRQGSHASEMVLSPLRDRVAIICDIEPEYIFPPLIRRVLHSLANARTQLKSEIWVCGIDGSGLHLIGAVQDPSNAKTDSELQWLPDGKSLSFVYDNRLWVTRAD